MQIHAQPLASVSCRRLTRHDPEVAALVPAQDNKRARPMPRAHALAQMAATISLRDFL